MATHHFKHLLCLFVLHLISQGHSYFMTDSKAVLQTFTDRWTLQENQRVPQLFQMTVCMDVRLMTAGKWMAFSYITPRSPYYDLALQGDSDAVYTWLLGVQHRFPLKLALERWHRLCLAIDSLHNSFSLTISSSQNVYKRIVIVNSMRPNGKLQLGFHPWNVFPGTSMATMELYLFRMWGDVSEHSTCEDGTIVGWDSSMWRISRPQARVQDNTLSCSKHNKWNEGTTTKDPTRRGIHSTASNQSTTPKSVTTSKGTTKDPTRRRSHSTASNQSTTPKSVTTSKGTTKDTTRRRSHSTASNQSTTPKSVTTSKGTTKDPTRRGTLSATTKGVTTRNGSSKGTTRKGSHSTASNHSTTTKAVTITNVPSKYTIRKGTHSSTLNHPTTTKATSHGSTKGTTTYATNIRASIPSTSKGVTITNATTKGIKGTSSTINTTSAGLNLSSLSSSHYSSSSHPNIKPDSITTALSQPQVPKNSTLTASTVPAPEAATSTPSSFLQAAKSSALFIEPFVLKCNYSQLCTNKTSYYWMFVNVDVKGGNKSIEDIRAWFSDLFSTHTCDVLQGMENSSTTYASERPSVTKTNTDNVYTSCQNSFTATFQRINLECEDKVNFIRTTCTVLLQLSQPIDPCSIRQLLHQESSNSALQAQLIGDAVRVGKNLCLKEATLPPGVGIVRCSSSSLFFSDVCLEEMLNVTCSYMSRIFISHELSEIVVHPCKDKQQDYCDCHTFCGDSGALYAFSLDVKRSNVTVTDIKNAMSQLQLHLDLSCNSTIIPQHLCKTISTISAYYQGLHVQCYGNPTSCMVALRFSQTLDVCILSEVLASLFQSSSIISYNGTLTRMALCGSLNDSEITLFNSMFTWISTNVSSKQICDLSNTQLHSLTSQSSCAQGQVLALLLNEHCTVPPQPNSTLTPLP